MSLIDKELILYLTLVHMNKYTRAQHITELQGKNNIANKSEEKNSVYVQDRIIVFIDTAICIHFSKLSSCKLLALPWTDNFLQF